MCRIAFCSRVAVLLAIFAGACSMPAAELVPIQSLDSLESRLLADAADGRLDQFSLLQGALIAGGVDRADQLRAAQEQLAAKWRELDDQSLANLPSRERIRILLAALHRLLLTGKYKADCTEPHLTLQSGDFNCVTATILFLELSRRNHIRTISVAVPGHVYCRVQQTPALDVQTTCREWLDVSEGRVSSPEAKALLQQMDSRGKDARELNDVELLGKVYYNRGVSLLEQNEFAAAVSILHTSLKLDANDQPARNNLLAAYNNWALALCDQGDYSTAVAKLSEGHKHDATYVPLLTNDLHVHQKWVLALCDRGRYADAIELLERGYQRRPDAPLFDGGRFAVFGLWSKSLLEANQTESAISVLDAARKRYGQHDELLRQEIAAFESGVTKLISLNHRHDAHKMLQVALQRHPQAESLRKLSPAAPK